MKKCVKFLTGVLTAFTLIASVFPTTPVNAETAKKTYTVTFRAGNVGSFNLEAGNIRGENIEATENYTRIFLPSTSFSSRRGVKYTGLL